MLQEFSVIVLCKKDLELAEMFSVIVMRRQTEFLVLENIHIGLCTFVM